MRTRVCCDATVPPLWQGSHGLLRSPQSARREEARVYLTTTLLFPLSDYVMDSEEFASIIVNFPVVRPNDFIADCWVRRVTPFPLCVEASRHSTGIPGYSKTPA